MSDIGSRYSKVATGFGERVDGVPASAWDNATPCEGWVARDIVRHLVEWMSAFPLATAEIDVYPLNAMREGSSRFGAPPSNSYASAAMRSV